MSSSIKILSLVAAFAVIFAGAANSQVTKSVGLLKGEVTAPDGTPIPNIGVVIYRGTERISNGKTSPEGKFSTILQPSSTYRIAYNSTEFGYHEDTLIVPALAKYQEFPVHAVLSAIHEGQYFPLNTPLFLPKSSTMEANATAQLDEIVNLMKHNPKLKLGVTVYPDAPIKTKKDAAQQKLVDSRATAVRSYFLAHGVNPSMIQLTSSTIVPAGRFQIAGQAIADDTTPKKKKSKKAAESKPGLVPQYIDVVAHLS